MSALGQKQTFAVQYVMSALHPKADMCGALAHVRFVPIADIPVMSMSSPLFPKAPSPTGYADPACLILVSCRRQFELENRAAVCAGGHPNPTVMVFHD